jgi:hypothetical protein
MWGRTVASDKFLAHRLVAIALCQQLQVRYRLGYPSLNNKQQLGCELLVAEPGAVLLVHR